MTTWRLLAGFMIVALLIWPNCGSSSPVKGRGFIDDVELPAGHPGKRSFKADFLGGERTCFIIKGDHKPIVDIGIEVYDDKNNLVAKDDGKGDLAAVIWYPPEDGTYTIVITNPNDTINQCYVIIR